jgi:hypothetical protein
MKKLVIPAVVLLATCLSGAALAIQKDITITGIVDNSINITQINGTELPSTVHMSYTPGQGLSPVSIPVTIYNNAAGGTTPKGVNVRLSTAPLLSLTSDNSVTERLSVSLGQQRLSTSDVLFDKNIANYDDTSKKSQQLNLVIKQETTTALTHAGTWQGIVGLIFTPEA